MPGDHAFPYMKRSYYAHGRCTCSICPCCVSAAIPPEITKSVEEALNARELIKIHVLKNCADDGKDLAQILAERTHSEVVQVIGKMIVLYKPAKEEKDRKIILP